MFISFALSIFLSISCHATYEEFDRENFEDIWWGIQEYPICFNVHKSGDLLLYEESIYSSGKWKFYEPSRYIIDGKEEFIIEGYNEGCWDIYYKEDALSRNLTACKCTLRE